MKLEDLFLRLAEAFQTEPDKIRLDSTTDTIDGSDRKESSWPGLIFHLSLVIYCFLRNIIPDLPAMR